MEIQIGNIIKNLLPEEAVEVTGIMDLDPEISISYMGVNSRQPGNRILSKTDLSNLDLISQKGFFAFTGDAEKFTLYTEAERIRSAFQFDPLFAVNCSIVDPLPHQVEAVYNYLLPLPRIRFLLADDTGAGKTIMTGLLIKEMRLRGLLDRILIITPGGLTKQWVEDELGLKFNFRFKLVDRAIFNADPNVFHSSNQLVTSIDFLRNEDVLNVARETVWDLIVVDEAHKLSAYDYGKKRYKSKRYEALEALAPQSEHLLLLTATPHRGRYDTFKNLLQLLDPDIFSTDDLVTERISTSGSNEVANKFFIRRLKEDMKNWDGAPLFKPRHTKTVEYELTAAEKQLYDRVTNYLTQRKQEAADQRNIHVKLALMVMQRRLTSSVYAIMKTLQNRYRALQELVQLLGKNPKLWNQRTKLDLEFNTLDDYSELSDDERDDLEHIFADPRKFKLFTTARSIDQIQTERTEVRKLKEEAEKLYASGVEEQKLQRLRQFIRDQGVLDGRKLVIFTEHKDTLDYLEGKLVDQGYSVQTIYGQKSVDERRLAQDAFANESQILLATDAAGEGINLQFCNLLINWDIPWNPNRLEQRMGRIHRYGQSEEVYVFNLVAQNTREGRVMQRLLQKMDIIREQIGDDRVYDVISDVFEQVDLDTVMGATFEGETEAYVQAIDEQFTRERVEEKIKQQREEIATHPIDFSRARELMNDSLEKRLVPIYMRRFFLKAFEALGGKIILSEDFVHLTEMPDTIRQRLREEYNLNYDTHKLRFTFNKQLFLEKRRTGRFEMLYYLSPGNPVFDATVVVTLDAFREEVLRGTILVDPEGNEPYFAYFVRSEIADQSRRAQTADERLVLVYGNNDQLAVTSPAKLIDLLPPATFAKTIEPPAPVEEQAVVRWSYRHVTQPQLTDATERIGQDLETRQHYLSQGFTALILHHTAELNDLQGKLLLGNNRVEERVERLENKIRELQIRRTERHAELEGRKKLTGKLPTVLGSAYVVPLSQLEYRNHYGMRRDDEVEAIAMRVSMDYEKQQGRDCRDVSADNLGYDLSSTAPDRTKRYIEVKGRAREDAVMLSENEMNRLRQLGNLAWLYVVVDCKTTPRLFRVQDPGNTLTCEERSRGVQYFVPLREWKSKATDK